LLENFTSVFGATFYRLPLNEEYGSVDGYTLIVVMSPVHLIREPWVVPESLTLGGEAVVCFAPGGHELPTVLQVVPLKAGETLPWKCVREA
jgi:dihydroorotase